MRKTRRLYNKFWHQSGLPKHYRKSVMSRSLTWGLVRLTTTDIFKPYQKQEHVRLLALGWDRMANWILSDAPWGVGAPDNILWEQFNRGTEGSINTRGVRFVRSEEEK